MRLSQLSFPAIATITWLLHFSLVVSTVPAFPFQSNDETEQRSIGEYRSDVKTFMKLSKDADLQNERTAVFNLCQLHWEIVSDSRFDSNQRLQGMRAVVANRLETYTKDHRNSLLRAERKKRRQSDDRTDVAVEKLVDDKQSSNAGNAARASATVSIRDSANDTKSKPTEDELIHQSAADSYYTMGALTGGPNQLFNYAGGGLAAPWDNGEALVELIVSTIDPSAWRRNGGSASIQYYQPLRVLVVHAPLQSHGDTADLLNRLRGADGNIQLNIGAPAIGIGN